MQPVLTDLDWQVVLHYVFPLSDDIIAVTLRGLVPPKVTVLKQRAHFPFTFLH